MPSRYRRRDPARSTRDKVESLTRAPAWADLHASERWIVRKWILLPSLLLACAIAAAWVGTYVPAADWTSFNVGTRMHPIWAQVFPGSIYVYSVGWGLSGMRLPLWMPLALTLAYPAYCAAAPRMRRLSRRVERRCESCGYPLVGLSRARCPECGATFSMEVFDNAPLSVRAALFGRARLIWERWVVRFLLSRMPQRWSDGRRCAASLLGTILTTMLYIVIGFCLWHMLGATEFNVGSTPVMSAGNAGAASASSRIVAERHIGLWPGVPDISSALTIFLTILTPGYMLAQFFVVWLVVRIAGRRAGMPWPETLQILFLVSTLSIPVLAVGLQGLWAAGRIALAACGVLGVSDDSFGISLPESCILWLVYFMLTTFFVTRRRQRAFGVSPPEDPAASRPAAR